MSIWWRAEHLEPLPAAAQVTLGEGDTPLVRSRRIGPAAGLPNLFFKLETTCPTGSFKDRFAAAAVSHMRARQQTRCIATSSGNTGSALAAYCAAAGMACWIAIVETAPQSKLEQMMAYGARIFRVRGFGLDPQTTAETFARLQHFGAAADASLEISAYRYAPLGMSGVETIAHELAEQLPATDHLFCPAGGGGLCVAVAKGYAALARMKPAAASPAVHCVQPEGNDTIATPLRSGEKQARDVQCTSKISGLQVAGVVDGHMVIEYCRPTGGTGHVASDEHVWHLQKRLAREEGIFCEPAGAVALAGALQAAREGLVQAEQTIVCLVTGSGFKDQASLSRMVSDADCPLIDLAEMDGIFRNA